MKEYTLGDVQKARYGIKGRPKLLCRPGRTKQAHVEECNINNLVRKYQQQGVVVRGQLISGDFSDVKEYQEALNIVNNVEEQFENLPSAARKRFGNDPSQMLEFVSNPENKQEMIKLGLATEKPSLVTRTGNDDKSSQSKAADKTADKENK